MAQLLFSYYLESELCRHFRRSTTQFRCVVNKNMNFPFNLTRKTGMIDIEKRKECWETEYCAVINAKLLKSMLDVLLCHRQA